MKPEQISIFTHRTTAAWYDKWIILLSAPLSWTLTGRLGQVPTHAGFKVIMDTGDQFGYDATLDTDWSRWDWSREVEWARTTGAWTKVYPLPLNQAQMNAVVQFADLKLGCWTYAALQLALMARQRWGHKDFKASPNQVVCSEAPVRCLLPVWPKLLDELGVEKPDYVAPVDWTIYLEKRLGITPAIISADGMEEHEIPGSVCPARPTL